MTLADGTRTRPHAVVGVLDRTMAILDAVQMGARSFTQIVEATGLTRSTAHRLIKAMEDHGLLISSGGRGYRLGPRLLGLAATATRDLPLRDLARPALAELAADTGESAQLYVREGDRRVCIEAVESASELRTIVAVGASLPLTKGSAGTVFLAWAGEGGPEGDAVRARGWADSVGEREPGVASLSAPVLYPHGSVAAVVSVSGPAERFGADRGTRFAPAVQAAAREIGAALGASAG
jgi:DNA-binding IclR family transcriptional regulator